MSGVDRIGRDGHDSELLRESLRRFGIPFEYHAAGDGCASARGDDETGDVLTVRGEWKRSANSSFAEVPRLM